MSRLEKAEIKIPSVGESIVEASIGKWFFSEGEWVEKDSALLELETDKATVEVVSPESGVLEIKTASGETVPIGAVVGFIDLTKSKPSSKKSNLKDEKESFSSNSSVSASDSKKESQKTAFKKESSLKKESSFPQSHMEAESKKLKTPEHSLSHLGPSRRKALREGRLETSNALYQPVGSHGKEIEEGQESTDEKRKPMSFLRQKIAERLMDSQKNTATLTTFNEVDLSQLMGLRKKLKQKFEMEKGVKLGFMSFFVKALSYARESYPTVCARIDEKDIVYSQFFNVSIAVSTDRGLVVPVLRKVDQLSYSEIEKSILEISEKARNGKLTPDSMIGGNITLSNGGVFGSLLSTPILNPPQSAILGMHKTEMRPQAIPVENQNEYKVEIRPMMYLALSYDHRIIDGSESVGFLVKVKEYLEQVTEDLIF